MTPSCEQCRFCEGLGTETSVALIRDWRWLWLRHRDGEKKKVSIATCYRYPIPRCFKRPHWCGEFQPSEDQDADKRLAKE